ncbi:hypothetical protein TNCV_2657181 [Trichonephila clavipes]|uniref:Tc1-like transposase DDE domain-containing protein n=1 Tax=Trichonephila clavipes TaxID=2585209 RepID=A0A8X6V4H0_TRICX|nr:hypothetical protein TNCV_2657181 [Trichonephila clavipes]
MQYHGRAGIMKHVVNGTMTGQQYIDEVLLPHLRLFRGAVGDKFVFMDDNTTCHRTLAVTRHCFQSDFRLDFSPKPETDESHLVRDQDCDTGTPNQQLQYGFALPSTSVDSHYHPTTKRQI